MLNSTIKKQIIEEAIATPNQEICGAVLNDGSIYPMVNYAVDPQNNFSLDPGEFDKIRSSVSAIYHSHCLDSQPGQLSPIDIANSKALKLPYILFHRLFHEWDYYNPNDIYPYPLIPNPYLVKELGYYLGWRFEYNRCDCYTLIRSYYKGMLDIDIPDFHRNTIEEIDNPEWNMFLKNFSKAGFEKLDPDETVVANDVILMSINGKTVHHAALLVNPSNGKAIHNLGEGRLSELFMYGGYWRDITRCIVRFNKKKLVSDTNKALEAIVTLDPGSSLNILQRFI
jgi:proteasome lid subunit RPN8/RPN11